MYIYYIRYVYFLKLLVFFCILKTFQRDVINTNPPAGYTTDYNYIVLILYHSADHYKTSCIFHSFKTFIIFSVL